MTRRAATLALLLGCAAGPLAGQDAPPDSAVVLPPIEISVTRTPSDLRQSPFALAVLRGPSLATADLGLSLPAALAAVPGVAAQARGNAARDESLSIRGFGARAAFGVRGIRILLDGIPLTLPDGQSQLTVLNLRRVGSVEVLRGTASAMHGNATGGVISLRSDPAIPARPAGDARVAGGSYGLLTADAGLQVPLAGGVGHVSVQRDAASGYRDQSRFEVWRAHLGARMDVAGLGTVGWLLDAADYPEAQDPGALNAAEVAADPRQANPSYAQINAGKAVRQVQTGASLQRPLGRGGELEVAAFAANRDLDNRLPFAGIVIRRWAWGGRVVSTLPLAAPLSLVAGADVQWLRDDRVNRTADGTAVTRDQLETVREIGPFVQLRYAPVPRVSVLGGVRYDWVTFGVTDRLPAGGDDSGTRTMQAPSGVLGVTVDVARPVTAWVRVGTAFETPTTTELANQPDGSNGFNPDLEPQHAAEAEVGVRVTHAAVSAGVAAFRAAVRDELVPFEVETDPGRRYFRNAGRARHQGIELDARVVLPHGVWVGATYTLSDLRFTDYATDSARYDGNRIPGVPPHLGRVASGVRLGPVGVEAEVRAASDVYADDGNTATADAWWVADLKLTAEVAAAGWRFQPVVGVENLFDERYVGAVAVNGAFGRYYEPAADRTWYVGLVVSGG